MADPVESKSTNRKDFIQECKSGKLDGVVAAYRTFPSVSITGVWDEELVQALPDSFKMVAHNGKPDPDPRPCRILHTDSHTTQVLDMINFDPMPSALVKS